MTWLTDTSQVILNEWHVCFNAVSNTKFSAMAVNVDDEVQWLKNLKRHIFNATDQTISTNGSN